jgi:hypothetical protein
MTNKFLLTILFIFTTPLLYSQHIGEFEVKSSQLTKWSSKIEGEYQGVYEFGFSESESVMVIYYDNGRYYAQLSFSTWDEQNNQWLNDFKNALSLDVSGNDIRSDFFNGVFVIYDDGVEKHKSLMIKSSTFLLEKNEIGLKTGKVIDYFEGDFPQASFRKLKYDELQGYSKDILRKMRNEIFARYYYIFEYGGEMYNYFSKKEWYRGEHRDVSKYLTPIEKYNIEIIQKLENL